MSKLSDDSRIESFNGPDYSGDDGGFDDGQDHFADYRDKYGFDYFAVHAGSDEGEDYLGDDDGFDDFSDHHAFEEDDTGRGIKYFCF